MPVGRFRDDPRELEDRERAIFARQHAEGALVVGSLLGTVVPVGLQVVPLDAPAPLTSPIAVIVGVIVGGVGGYLLGYAYRERRRRDLRGPAASGGYGDDGAGGADAGAAADEWIESEGDGPTLEGDSGEGERAP